VTVWIADDDEALSREAAQRILRALTAKPNLLLCAAGGSTPRRAYQLLVENHASNPRAFQSLRIVKLDEWGGIAMDDPGSCETQLRKLLVDPLDLSLERYFGLRSDAETPELECEKLRDRLAIDGPVHQWWPGDQFHLKPIGHGERVMSEFELCRASQSG